MVQSFEVAHLTHHLSQLLIGLLCLSAFIAVVYRHSSKFTVDDNLMATAGSLQQLCYSAFAHNKIYKQPRCACLGHLYWTPVILQKMMKQPKEKDTHYRTEEVEGPPLDYSFRSIRTLAELAALQPSEPKQAPTTEESKPTENPGQQASEKDLGESAETKLNIVRTIDVEGGKDDLLKHFVNKKTEKATTKVFKKTQVKTTSLFLRYNKITALQGLPEVLQQILPNKWQQLVWLDLSHNRLTTVSKELQLLPQLKNLYLHVNFISAFKEFENLQGAKLLRTFTIHGNPIENFPEFRCLLAAILPQLQKLDSALLTKREHERAQVLKKQNAKYPLIPNPPKPPEDSQEEEES